jgi:hypothetical protein
LNVTVPEGDDPLTVATSDVVWPALVGFTLDVNAVVVELCAAACPAANDRSAATQKTDRATNAAFDFIAAPQ